jgi:GNAT superfamily N-acetyltransferase
MVSSISSESEPFAAEISPAGIDHWADIRSLHALAFRKSTSPAIDPDPTSTMLSRIYSPDYTDTIATHDLLAAWYDCRVIGTAGWVPSNDAGTLARITSVFVSPFYARMGIGRRLVTAAEARARAAGFRAFAVRAFQPSAAFFECLGYVRSSQGVQSIGTEDGIPIVFLRKDAPRWLEAAELADFQGLPPDKVTDRA